jgi:centromere protein C
MLFCHQGAVRVLVHRTEFSVAQGGFFLIPRGNSYQINNLTDIDAILVFTQAKEVEAIVDAEDEAGRDD